MMFKDKRRNATIGFAIAIITIFLAMVLSILLHGFDEAYAFNFGEFAIALATLLLAYYTFQLGYGEVESSRLERQRLRLKEQLENFYSHLMSEIELFGNLKEHYTHDGKINILLGKIKNQYHFYASNKLRDQLEEYYLKFEDRQSNYMRKLRIDEGTEKADKFLSDKLSEIKQTIKDDYKKKRKKYIDLTQE